MNDYEISKLKKELQRKQELLKEEQEDRQQTQKQLIQVSAERDKYHTELLIARKQIENIDKIIAENVRSMKSKLEEENSNSLNQLKDLRQKLKGQQFLNEKLVEQNRNKDATIAELSARLREMSKKYKDPSLLVNTKQISEQAMITHNQFYKLTEKYNKLSKDMENIMAENKILRKLHGVPDNFGFDLEEIKIAEKQQLEDYKAQCRKLETQIEELEAQRTQLRYRLRQYNTLYSNKGERYKDMTQKQLELLDEFALNLKEGKFELPQIDKSQKEMERQILKLRAQVQVLQNKAPMQIMSMNGNQSNQNASTNDQLKKIQDQIKSYLEPFVQDIKKISESNINGLIQNLQNIQNAQVGQNINGELGLPVPNGGFKGPIPLPIAHNDWSKIKEGYSFLYSSKIPVDLKDLEGDVSFDVVKAKYQIAALQLQNIESLKLLKEKQKVENQLSREIFQLKEKYKKCLKVQDQLFIRYFKEKESVNDKIKKLQIEKHQLNNEKNQLEAKLAIVSASFDDISRKGDIEKRLNEYTSRLALSEAEVLKVQRKFQILQDEQKLLRQTYTNLESKLIQTEFNLKQKLTASKSNEKQLAFLLNKTLDEVKDSVSSEVHDVLLQKMQIMNDKTAHMINKETQLRLKVQKLQGIERDSTIKDDTINTLREDNLELLLELQIVKNRLRTVDLDYRTYYDTLERFVKFINENNTSLMNCFKRFDKDNSGTLSKKEFGDALKDLRFGLSEVELDLLFAEFDQDGSDKLTYKEFIKKMRRAGAVSRSKDDEAVLKLFRAIQQSKISVRRAFEIIDRDGSKQISKSEMLSALKQIGIETSTQTVNALFKLCDTDGDDKITCPQFERLYRDLIKQSESTQKQFYSEQIDWKLAFVLKLEEVSLRFKSSLAQTFKKLDDDGNSVLTMTELIEFVKKADMTIDTSSLQELFGFLDRRRDGKVQYGEFLKVLAEAKSEKQRIERIKFVRERTKELKAKSQVQILSRKTIESSITRNGEVQKLKIRVEALSVKHNNLVKRNQELAEDLANKEQRVKDLERSLQMERKEKQSHLDKYHEERLSKITMKTLNDLNKSEDGTALLKKQLNEVRIKIAQVTKDLQLYKGLYEGLTDKNKGQQLRVGKLQAQRNKYYDIVKQLQSTSDLKAQVGKLHIQLEYSKRNEEIINSKYDKIMEELRKVDTETRKLSQLSNQRQKQIINVHMFFQQKSKLQQMKIDDLSLKIIPAITIEKMQDYMMKLRDISTSKSGLQEQNRTLRQANYNLQARNDYVQNQRIHIEELQRKLRNQYTDDTSKAIIDLTKKLSDYKMNELKARREMNLLKEKEEYYLRVQNNHSENVKQLEEELSGWEIKFNEREEFWRKRLADQIKLMEEFQQEANKAKQEQISAMNYFQQKNHEQQSISKKYQNLNQANYNNISQFISPQTLSNNNIPQQQNDEYVEGLLQKIEELNGQLMEKQRQIHHFKTTVKEIIPQSNLHKLMDFGSQMNVSTNSFVMQTELTSSQLKNNARRFLNNQKEIEQYYKEENARITQAAQQSIETLQRIIDDKNEQLRKKERIVQDLKKQFNQMVEKDCLEIQKLHEEIRELRSKTQLNSINQMMSKTTKQNFYPSSKAQNKLQEYQGLVNKKDEQIKNLQQKYDRLLISKTSAQGQKTAAKNAANSEKLKQKIDELNEEREMEKKKFQEKQKQFRDQISKLNKTVDAKTKNIEQLKSALKDIKQDIIKEKSTLSESQAEQNLKTFVQNMSKGANKNDAVIEQYMQSALVKIKNLESQNHELREELNKAKNVMNKTANRFGR